MGNGMSEKLVLIDGHSILNRAFYGIPDLTNSEGVHTNAVYGFLNIMYKILDEEGADKLIVAFDVHAPTYRHKLFEAYKGTRKAMPDELREQVPVIKKVLEVMNIKTVEKEGYEADDLLGALSQKAESMGYEVSIVSGDRDLLQLATNHIKIRIPKTKMSGTEIEDYYANDVIERYQVTPKQFIDVKALMGDTADNIPGVPGIGEKTATKIILEYGDIETAIDNAQNIKPKKASENLKTYEAQARMSKTLATIDTSCEVDVDIDAAKLADLYNEEAYKIFNWLEFKNILNRFDLDTATFTDIGSQVVLIDQLADLKKILSTVKVEKNIGIHFLFEDVFNGCSLCFDEKKIYFVFINETITKEYLMTYLNSLKEKNIQLCFLDVKQQLSYIYIEETEGIFDAGIAAYLLNPLKSTYEYNDIARDYLGLTIPPKADIIGKNSIDSIYCDKLEDFKNYVGYLSYVPYQSWELLIQKLEETQMSELYRKIEIPLAFKLYEMEDNGIKVAKAELKAYGDGLVTRIEMLEKEIYALAGEKFNINSPKQLGVILFEKLKLPFAKKTKTGYSTSADILDKLRTKDPIINLILEYRQLTKLKSTYADGLGNYIGESDQRIHGKFNQKVTATGRISSTEPNLQNIPVKIELGRLIRKVFIPEEDYVFVDADYSQIELRVLAHFSGDEKLIEAYKKEQDIHKITASQVFNTPLDEVTPLQRSNAKAVNFGIVYGISSFGLSQGLSITPKEAETYIKQYFATYPKIKECLDLMVESAKKNGYTKTLFNRRRPVPELKSSNFMQRSFGERIAMNSPIQGTAADIIKIAMIRVSRKLHDLQMKSRLVLQVHDELLIEAHKDEVEEVKNILLQEMEHAADLLVPLEVDINVGRNWYEAK